MIKHLGKNISIDLNALIDTRMLVQANSGGGKSYLLRKLLEETHGKVQQIVLDIEGDFASLREKYDFVLAGKGGDIPADPKSAELLALKSLELRFDLIVDLYELKQHERIRFVRLFLEAMINAPKNLWHPVLLVLDEAHIFAPEKGQAESMSAVIDIATRGRKRGFSIVLATQRLSKLHKDAAAECNNKLIGRTGLDIDIKRASDELGFVGREDTSKLRHLEPGQFFTFGPAISRNVVLGTVGETQTSHPKAGRRGLKHMPAPTASVKATLKKLQDLPQEAAEELKDRSALQGKVKELERELRSQQKAAPKEISNVVIERIVKKAKSDLEKDLHERIIRFENGLDGLLTTLYKSLPRPSTQRLEEYKKASVKFEPTFVVSTNHADLNKPIKERIIKKEPDGKLGACERSILGFLFAKSESSFTKVQVGAMTGYANSSGGFNNALSRLFQLGFISRGNGRLQITPQGFEECQKMDLSGFNHRLEDWIAKLGACERKVYSYLLERPSDFFQKEVIAGLTGYSPGSGGFNNALSRLNTLGLIEKSGGQIRLNSEVAAL